MLVYGGTFTPEGGNRAKEDAINLKPCDLNALRVFEQGVAQATDVKGLVLVLNYLAENNMNIVGEFGAAYSSKGLSRVLGNALHDVMEARLLPRTGGLRAKFIELIGG